MRLLRLIAAARTALPRVLPLMRDQRVPSWLKFATGIGALLIISPLDLLGDIPVLGLVDDAALLALLAVLFVRFATALVERTVQPVREPKPVQPLLRALQ